MRELETNCPNIRDDYGGKVVFPFGPCIYQNFISEELRKSLLKEGKKIRNKDNDYNKRLAGNMYFGGSYNYSAEYMAEVFPEFLKILFQWFDFLVYHYDGGRVNFAPGKEDLEVSLDTLWINYQRRYDHNPPHQHHGIVSFVVYLDVPEKIFKEQANSNVQDAGKIVFKYGESISPLSVNGWNVTPENNLILMFPATLDHMVHPFWVDEERVSVSGNFTLTDRIVLSQNGA